MLIHKSMHPTYLSNTWLVADRPGGSAVLVDTGGFVTAQLIYSQLRAWTDQPLHTAIYTHGHVDHVFGVRGFDEEAKRKGQTVPYITKGTVRFQHEGANHELTVFGPADTSQGDYLWLPFFDATSGKETYAGGRYLDLEVGPDGMVEVDLNYA